MVAARRVAVQLRPAARGRAGRSSWPGRWSSSSRSRVGYPWASDRLHAFVLQGMADNARAVRADAGALRPLRRAGAGRGPGLLEALAARRRRGRHRRRAGLLPAADDRRGRRAASTSASKPSTATACSRCAPSTASSRPRSRFARTCRRRCRAPRRRAAAGSRSPASVCRRACPRGGAGTLASRRRRSSTGTAADAREPADRPRRRAGRGAGRAGAGASPSRDVRRPRSRHLRRRPQHPDDRGQRAVAVSALRPRLGARGLRRGDDARGLASPQAGRERRTASARAGGASTPRRRGVPRRARHVARARLQRSAATAPTTTATTSLPAWARATLASTPRDPRPQRLHARAARARRDRTIRSGTPRSGSCRARAASTTTCACCGARRSSSGRARRARARDDDRAQQQVRRSTAATRTPTAASSGCSGASIGRGGPSARSSGRCAT